MSYALLTAVAVALAAIYKFLPNKKYFPYLCLISVTVFFAATAVHRQNTGEETISRAKYENIHLQQKIFADWYAEYQKDINRLDGNWLSYHTLVENFLNEPEEPNIADFYEQMSELEKDFLDEQLKIHMLNIPPELDAKTEKPVAALIKKMQHYVDAQTKTVTLTKEAADPKLKTAPDLLKKKITEIMIRESPVGLFTAGEVSAIRDALTLPEEDLKTGAAK